VQRRGRLALRGELAAGRVQPRPVRAAFERAGVEPGLGEHAACGGHVRRLAVVRGAGQRQLGIGQLQRIGRAAGHQRQRLQQLDRRAREYGALDLAEREHAAPVAIDDRHRTAVRRLQRAAAQRFDEQGVVAVHD